MAQSCEQNPRGRSQRLDDIHMFLATYWVDSNDILNTVVYLFFFFFARVPTSFSGANGKPEGDPAILGGDPYKPTEPTAGFFCV